MYDGITIMCNHPVSKMINTVRIIFLVGILTEVFAENHRNPPATVVKGAFVVPITDTLLCNSLYSIEFLVDLPNITISSEVRPCKAKKHLCVLLQHAHQIQSILATEIYDKSPYISKSPENKLLEERLERGLFNFVGDIHHFLWGTATDADINNLHADIGKLAFKFNKFSENNHMYMDGVAANLSAYSKNLSHAISSGFAKVQQELNKTSHDVNQIELVMSDVSNFLIINQHLQTVVYLLDDVAADCRNNLIPRAVLNNTLLFNKLKDVNQAVAAHGFAVASSLNQLLRSEIASCLFAPGKIKIVLRVPIKRKGVNLKMFKIIHSPFSFHDKECALENPPTYIVQSGNIMIPIIDSIASMCPISSKKVCLIPDGALSPSSFSNCAAALAESKPGEIASKCIMRCQKATAIRVNPISSQQFQITNAKNFTIRCDDGNSTNYYLQDSVGAIHLRLDCQCQASIHDHFLHTTHVLKPSWPCMYNTKTNGYMITNIIPVQMSSLKSAVFAETSDLYDNVSDIFNDKWQYDIPTLSLEPPKQIQFSQEFISEELNHTVNHSYTVLFIWVSLLTVGLVALGALFVMNCLGQGRPNAGFSPVPFMLILLPMNVFATLSTDKTVTFKSYMWNIIETLEIVNVVVNAVIFLFVVSVLIVLYKSLKNIRLINRMIRAWDSGEDLLVPRNY